MRKAQAFWPRTVVSPPKCYWKPSSRSFDRFHRELHGPNGEPFRCPRLASASSSSSCGFGETWGCRWDTQRNRCDLCKERRHETIDKAQRFGRGSMWGGEESRRRKKEKKRRLEEIKNDDKKIYRKKNMKFLWSEQSQWSTHDRAEPRIIQLKAPNTTEDWNVLWSWWSLWGRGLDLLLPSLISFPGCTVR